MVRCIRCNLEVPEDQSYVHRGNTLCEDCYLESIRRVRACDPWAVHHARCTRRNLALEPGEELSQLQRQLHAFILKRGKASIEEIMERFGLSAHELENELAILRHCELIRGCKENGGIYLVPFQAGR